MTIVIGAIPSVLSPPDRAATHTGPDAVAHAFRGLHRRRVRVAPLLRRAHDILRAAQSLADEADAGLLTRAEEHRAVVRRRTSDDATINAVFGLTTETIRRHTGLTLHAEQIAAALAMSRGAIAELATGEGKTLAAILPAVLAGWRARGCHIVTANDYLAQRDSTSNAPIFARLGLCGPSLTRSSDHTARAAAYRADITYATARELAADHLRDRLGMARAVQRPLAEAIIDEADFVLIDDAATPLILASPSRTRDETDAILRADQAAQLLIEGSHFTIVRSRREILLRPAADANIDLNSSPRSQGKGQGGEAIEATPRRVRELVTSALRAHHLFRRDHDYAVIDGRVMIIDERTGRISTDRRWRDGLHEAIEAKEGLTINPSDDTLASISFQRFLCRYPRLSGMTGTARQCAAELWSVYWLPTAIIPTHHPVARHEQPPRTMASFDQALIAAADEAIAVSATGRPVLIGTTSVDASERLAAHFRSLGVDCPILNAVRHADEARIIAAAGNAATITIATNMAGRGTDIALAPSARDAGGLHVIALGHYPSRRLDRQLFGRAGRQGDPGTARVIRSPGDDLLRRNTSPLTRLVPLRLRFSLIQALAERRARRERRAVMRRDHTLDDLLAFASR